MRRDIEFDAGGTTLRGWLYLPAGDNEPFPMVVMAHGWGAVKEMYLEPYAQVFADAGLGVLVFDHRNFKASDGLPRQEIDPWMQVSDYRHAITHARSLAEVDRDRIGIWGTSYSGGHVLVVGAVDWRVACVVAQCPTISGWRNTLRRYPAAALKDLRDRLDADRQARARGTAPAMVPIAADLDTDAFNSGSDAVEAIAPVGNDGAARFSNMHLDRRSAWRNETTLQSLDLYAAYEPGAYIRRIAPKPLLVMTGDSDTLTPTDEILAAHADALEPKRLLILPGGHHDLYGTGRAAGTEAARQWFVENLAAAR